MASESRARAKVGGNFGKVNFNSLKPKGGKKEVAPVCSLLLVLFGHSDMADSCNLMGCSPPDSSVHGISQARILEWVAISSPRGSSQARDQTCLLQLLHWQADSSSLVPSGKMNWEAGTDIYTLLCIKQITKERLLYRTGNSECCGD